VAPKDKYFCATTPNGDISGIGSLLGCSRAGVYIYALEEEDTMEELEANCGKDV